jgi:hypothetical protein
LPGKKLSVTDITGSSKVKIFYYNNKRSRDIDYEKIDYLIIGSCPFNICAV